jgi:hypothetical protein
LIKQRRPADVENDRSIRQHVQDWARVDAGTLTPRQWVLGMVVAMKPIRTILAEN